MIETYNNYIRSRYVDTRLDVLVFSTKSVFDDDDDEAPCKT